MAAIYLTQAAVTTRTERVRKRVLYLEDSPGLRERAVAAIRQYLVANPRETAVTLAVLRAVGRAEAERLARGKAGSLRTVNQDIGMWAPLLLLEMYPPEAVETLRQLTANGWASVSGPRPRGGEWEDLDWVTSFTQHRLAVPGQSEWRRDAVAEANAAQEAVRPGRRGRAGGADGLKAERPLDDLPPRYPVYRVWRRLLEALPEPLDEDDACLCAQAMFNQVVWRDRDLEDALADKLAALDRAPFPREVRDEVEHIYRSQMARQDLPGLGRFRAFLMGSDALLASGVAGPFLRELRELGRLGSAELVYQRVRLLAEDQRLPFLQVSRFAECMHLTRPELPFLNTQTREVMEDLMNAPRNGLLQGRHAYARHLGWMSRAQAALGLVDANALDSFLGQFGALYDVRFPEAYNQEMARFEVDFYPRLGPPDFTGDSEDDGVLAAAEPQGAYGVRRPQSPFRTNPRLVPLDFIEDPVLPLSAADWPEGELFPGEGLPGGEGG